MKWFKIISIIMLVAAGGAGGYAYYLYDTVKDTASQIYEPIKEKKSDLRKEEISVERHDPISILIMGVDKRGNDRGRSDSMVVLTVNPRTDSTLMFNIPRDTRTKIVGKGIQDKINHAYAFGGVPMTMKTVENFLQVPIDYYVKVDMEGFAQIIDTLGGVDVHNQFAFHYEGYSFPEGALHLNGVKALKYSRMRYDDPRGDLGRNERQRQVLRAVMDKAASPSILADLTEILRSLGSSVKTNISPDELQKMSRDYRTAVQNVNTIEIKGSGTKISGIYYYIVSEQERNRISEAMNNQLGLK
ncbi:LytR family transcriptional attenuator [Melghirimyces profundicolus]|uniref:LytR family transcriptional attenuator n=1 Tax=Melghirimyces profundicolus TaxID=1242148 RepID=A0A2T6BCG5_9BACL|nr:LCP family protein [Melghirimyces profundicolus]PTX53724.1 LytR family transcriptional attenuator [Melghirimyces profundicolus]